jgi:hypothetical protein
MLIVALMAGATLTLAESRSLEVKTADTDVDEAVEQALDFLQTRQLPNGGIEGWTAGEGDVFTTLKAVFALKAAARSMVSMTSVSDRTPIDYVAANAITFTQDVTGTVLPGRAGMVAVAAVAANQSPDSFGGIDLLTALTDSYHPATGAYSTTAQSGFSSGAANTTNQLWAILGLAADQQDIPAEAMDFLIGLQEADGGWGWGAGGDVDTTALVIQTLLAGGLKPTDEPIREGLAFLRANQVNSGGWEAAWGGVSADSTAASIQAIVAAGYKPATASWATGQGGNPRQELLGLQADDGSFGNALATAHVIPALTETPLPILGQRQRAELALAWMDSQQNANGSWSLFGSPDVGATADAVLAYVAAGYDPASVTAPGSDTSALDFLINSAPTLTDTIPDKLGKVIVAVQAAGTDPHDFGGADLVAMLDTHFKSDLGAFGIITNTWQQAWGILGWAAVDREVPTATVENLLSLQQPDGGWKYDLSTAAWSTTTPDSTGLAMQALMAAGVPPTDTQILSATTYLRHVQDDRAGWDNTNSTAYAIQGLLAAGAELEDDWRVNGHTPFDALASWQKSDGPFVWKWDNPWGPPADNALATWQAVPPLLDVRYPYEPLADLEAFEAVARGSDPDRLVAAEPQATYAGDMVALVLPFGNELDEDAAVTLDYRIAGGAWITGTAVHRAAGYYTATVPLEGPVSYAFQVQYADPDGVQFDGIMTESVQLTHALEPAGLYLPAILSQ